MCVATRGQQAKRMDVQTFKIRFRVEEEMFESKRGARALPADPLPVRPDPLPEYFYNNCIKYINYTEYIKYGLWNFDIFF